MKTLDMKYFKYNSSYKTNILIAIAIFVCLSITVPVLNYVLLFFIGIGRCSIIFRALIIDKNCNRKLIQLFFISQLLIAALVLANYVISSNVHIYNPISDSI